MFAARKLVLAHFWVAFAAFGAAILLGEWQMLVRSPLVGWVNNPEHYYRSVTFHGVVMAYVLPTLVAMAFGYAVCELSLKRPLVGLEWAWGGFWLVIDNLCRHRTRATYPRRLTRHLRHARSGRIERPAAEVRSRALPRAERRISSS